MGRGARRHHDIALGATPTMAALDAKTALKAAESGGGMYCYLDLDVAGDRERLAPEAAGSRGLRPMRPPLWPPSPGAKGACAAPCSCLSSSPAPAGTAEASRTADTDRLAPRGLRGEDRGRCYMTDYHFKLLGKDANYPSPPQGSSEGPAASSELSSGKRRRGRGCSR